MEGKVWALRAGRVRGKANRGPQGEEVVMTCEIWPGSLGR